MHNYFAASGFTGADLQNLMNEAAIFAARRDLKEISKEEIADALERIVAGPEKKGAVMSDQKKKLVAYHEVACSCLPLPRLALLVLRISLACVPVSPLSTNAWQHWCYLQSVKGDHQLFSVSSLTACDVSAGWPCPSR